MLRYPAVAGQFYPADPAELTALVKSYLDASALDEPIPAKACLVPHAGYMYSGAVAGAVFSRVQLTRRIILLGVRHYPRGEDLAILSSGAWRTPLGDAPVDEELAQKLKKACPLLKEDNVAHVREHSLEVELPFLQILRPGFMFVPIAVGTHDFAALQALGIAIAEVLRESREEILLVTSSDMNHYESDEATRKKDSLALDQLLKLDASGLLAVCRETRISMCGLGAAIAMLTAMTEVGARNAELIRYATSAEVSGDYKRVVGYAGMAFS
jgi:MEMO1 family protein